jgi:hypothetical protein
MGFSRQYKSFCLEEQFLDFGKKLVNLSLKVEVK